MTNPSYDIAIIGSGPIGSSVAYFLTHGPQASPSRRVALVTEEPTDAHSATYRFAGGSVRSWWTDPAIREMTDATIAFVRKLLADGVDLSTIEDHYLLLHRGLWVPSYNISGAKLVRYFLDRAQENGVVVIDRTPVERVEKNGGHYVLSSANRIMTARKVLLAVGAALPRLLPHPAVRFRKRQLLVLDTPIVEERQRFPHTVIPFAGGLVFLFLKKFDDGLQLVLGQEEVLTFSDRPEPEDFLPALRERGLDRTLPFLGDATVRRILWGFDDVKKTPTITTEDRQLYAVTCGSAVRSSVWIGRHVASLLAP